MGTLRCDHLVARFVFSSLGSIPVRVEERVIWVDGGLRVVRGLESMLGGQLYREDLEVVSGVRVGGEESLYEAIWDRMDEALARDQRLHCPEEGMGRLADVVGVPGKESE